MGNKTGPKGPTKYTDEFINNMTIELRKYAYETTIPFIKEFCYKYDIVPEEISRTLMKRSDDFRDAVSYLKCKQEVNLVKSALAGKTNATMAIFALKNVAGWRDNREEEKSDDRLESELEFVGVPVNKKDDRFKRFYN